MHYAVCTLQIQLHFAHKIGNESEQQNILVLLYYSVRKTPIVLVTIYSYKSNNYVTNVTSVTLTLVTLEKETKT